MKRKQDLYELISAMSKSEKRYFTLDAQKSGKKDSKYLELFKAINAMDNYDEVKLKKKFSKNLSADKAYLYDAIMRSMRDYRSSKSISAQVKELILDAKYLYERGLYDQSEDRLNDAKDLAKSIDDQIALLEINREERALTWLTQKEYETKFQELVEEKNCMISSISGFFEYTDVSTEVIIGMKKGYYENKDLLTAFIKNKVDFTVTPRSPREKQKFFLIRALYHQFLGELELASNFYSKIVQIWEENPEYKKEESFRYVNDISSLLNAYGKLDDVEKFPELIEKLEKESNANTYIKGATFYVINIYKLMYLINTGKEQHDLVTWVKEIESGLDAYKMNISRQIALMFNIMFLLFLNEKYELSNEWSKKVIKKIKMVNQITGLWASGFLRLLSAQEYMEREHLDNEIRNIDRLFQSGADQKDHKVMIALYQSIKEVINAPLLEVNHKLKAIKDYISQVTNEGTKSLPQGIDELLLLWVNSKLSRQKMTVLTARARKEKSKQPEEV